MNNITATAVWSSLDTEGRVQFMSSMLKAALVTGVSKSKIRKHVGPLSNPNKLAVKLGMPVENTAYWTDTFARNYATRTALFGNQRNSTIGR